MPPLVLALDLGGHAARLHAYAPSGKRLVEIEQPIEAQHPAPGRVEHDADQLLAACRSALRLGLAQLGMAWHGSARRVISLAHLVVAWHGSELGAGLATAFEKLLTRGPPDKGRIAK